MLIETRHLAFWQKFFDLKLDHLNLGRRLKLWCFTWLFRLFGSTSVHLVLEAIEVYGVRKYLALWHSYQDQPLGEAIKGILQDEFKHEAVLVTKLTERKINPEKIRNIFLGLNDGLMEILGEGNGGGEKAIPWRGDRLGKDAEATVEVSVICRRCLYHWRIGAGTSRVIRREGRAGVHHDGGDHGHPRIVNSRVLVRHGDETADPAEPRNHHRGSDRDLCDWIGSETDLGDCGLRVCASGC